MSLKGGISIGVDSGPLGYVLWCYCSRSQDFFTFIQIGSGPIFTSKCIFTNYLWNIKSNSKHKCRRNQQKGSFRNVLNILCIVLQGSSLCHTKMQLHFAFFAKILICPTICGHIYIFIWCTYCELILLSLWSLESINTYNCFQSRFTYVVHSCTLIVKSSHLQSSN